jgi:tellurite resistance protein TerC
MQGDQSLLFLFFTLFILAMLAIDLGVLHRTPRSVTLKEATFWSILWTILALIFNVGVWHYAGTKPALEFLTAYLIERALSMDNIFVFVIIFSYFGVPQNFQHRVLFWGVLGALIMRSLFIAAGVALIEQFEWVLYVFGIILVISGWKMMASKGIEVHPEKNIFIRAARRVFPVDHGYETSKFFVRKNGKVHLTSMFLVLITVETTDVVFAVDSIPAVFGVTQDAFIVYSSNIFAILGLRAMYFLLAGIMNTFYYLTHGLSLVLVFIGLKMLAADFVHIDIYLSLTVVVGILAISVAASLIRKSRSDSAAHG